MNTNERRVTTSSARSIRRRPLRSRQRGVALITAVLIVALAMILAADVSFKGYLDQRRFATALALDQGFQVGLGAEAWASDILARDDRNVDDFTEEWATPIPPLPIDGGEIEGFLEDMQGRFNLNNLVTNNGGVLQKNEPVVRRFERLLELLELETKWAGIIVDWIDSDVDAEFPYGAEDSIYTSQTPPYRTANMPITRASELLALADLTLEEYLKLEPFVTALPVGTLLNICTASPEVLDAFRLTQVEFTQARDNTAELRKQGCHPTKQAYTGVVADAALRQELESLIDDKTAYFRATIWVTIGTTQFTLYSLLHRPQNQTPRPLLRSFGTP